MLNTTTTTTTSWIKKDVKKTTQSHTLRMSMSAAKDKISCHFLLYATGQYTIHECHKYTQMAHQYIIGYSVLLTVSKVLERLVLACLRPHLLSSANFS